MSAAELVLVVGSVLVVLAFVALIVVLVRVLDALRSLRAEVDALRSETGPLLTELQATTIEARAAMATAREDLDRFDRVLGSAEAIGDAVTGTGRVARTALSAPVIKAAGVAAGTSRAVNRLRRKPVATATAIDVVATEQAPRRRRA